MPLPCGMVKKYSSAELARELPALPGWSVAGGRLRRSWKFEGFVEAVAFVDRLVPVAEEWEHHPDVHIHYDEVTLELWTHSEDAVTEWDVGLAKELSKL